MSILGRDPDAWIRESYTSWIPSGGRLGKASDQEVSAFIKARKLIIEHAYQTGKIGYFQRSSIKMNILYDSDSAVLADSNGKIICSVNLLDIKDKDTLEAINDFHVKSGAKKWGRNTSCTANSLGNRSGAAPLQKKGDSALGNLPNSLKDIFEKMLPEALAKISDVNWRNTVARRLLFVEYFHGKMTATESKLQAKSQALEAASTDDEKKALRSEINELRGLYTKLQNLDFYALSVVLIHLRPGTLWRDDLDAIAEEVRNHVAQDIMGNRGFLSRWNPLASKELNDEQKAYALDVAAMVYPDRASRFNFFYKHFPNEKPKNESDADVFVRAAVKFAETPPGQEYLGEEVKDSSLIDHFGERAKKSAAEDLGSISVVANHAIPHANYQDPIYPPGATEDERKAIDDNGPTEEQKNAIEAHKPEFLKAQLDQHRQAIDRKKEINDIVPPKVPSTVADNAWRGGAVVAAAARIAPEIASMPISTVTAPVVGAVASVLAPLTSLLSTSVPPVSPAPSPAEILATPMSPIPTPTDLFRGPIIEEVAAGASICPAPLECPAPSTLGSMAETAVSMVPASVSGAVNHLRMWASKKSTGELIFGLYALERGARLGYDFVRPMRRQPDGTLKREVSYPKIAFTAAALYAIYNMYTAVTDGVIDNSWSEFFGEYASKAIMPVVNATSHVAKLAWDNTTVFEITPGLTLPYFGRVWDGNVLNFFKLPVIPIGTSIVVKAATALSSKTASAVAARIKNPTAKKAAEAVESVATAADKVGSAILATKAGGAMGPVAVNFALGILPKVGYVGSVALSYVGNKGVEVVRSVMPDDPMLIPRQMMFALFQFGRKRGFGKV